jgi:hypothetical protein
MEVSRMIGWLVLVTANGEAQVFPCPATCSSSNDNDMRSRTGNFHAEQ